MATPDQPAPALMTWRLHREVVLLAGWGRAILLQLAHPLVAQGVADHSGFATDRRGHVKRLKRTLRAMLALTFGGPKGAEEAAAAINRIHDRVHGRLVEAAGSFAPGAPYSAHDPALLAWVHATLVDSFLLTYEHFVAPLTPAERDRYCREAGAGGPLLGIPPGLLPGSAPRGDPGDGLGAGSFGRRRVGGGKVRQFPERRGCGLPAEDGGKLSLVLDGTVLGAELQDGLDLTRADAGELQQLEGVGEIHAHLGRHGDLPGWVNSWDQSRLVSEGVKPARREEEPTWSGSSPRLEQAPGPGDLRPEAD